MIALTLAEYVALVASLPRGPFGPIGAPEAVLIVEEGPGVVIPRTVVVAAEAYAVHWRS